MVLFDFDITIPEAERDPQLQQKLWEEREGIFNWMASGAAMGMLKGLAIPDDVIAETKEYRRGEDTLGLFLEDCCTVVPGYKQPAKALRQRYELFCKEEGYRNPLGPTRFKNEMDRRKFRNTRNNQGVHYEGIKVNETEAEVQGRYSDYRGGKD
jgi:putative DNA primase/helicase